MHSEDIECSASASAFGASDEEQGNESNSSSVPLHSGDEQETSPSQYRKAMLRKSEAERGNLKWSERIGKLKEKRKKEKKKMMMMIKMMMKQKMMMNEKNLSNTGQAHRKI